MQAELTQRQRDILRRVVEEYVSTGQPVGSKSLAQRSGLGVSSSTVRYELAELESQGLLTHPHTSAGRVPTEFGYRYYVDRLLEHLEPRPPSFPLDLTTARRELDDALQATTEMLSQVTQLLALVSGPPLEATTVRHVEVLMLQPEVVMVVLITSSGSVSKRVFAFDRAVDAGLAEWAGEYLNEQLNGVRLGSRKLKQRLEDPGLAPVERQFLDVIRPALSDFVEGEQRVFVGGIGGVMTLPAWRGRGFARAALRKAVAFLDHWLGVPFALVICPAEAAAFLRRLGWQLVDAPIVCDQAGRQVALSGEVALVLAGQAGAWPPGPIDLCGPPW
jgi:heat shock gene repressor HrcA